MMVIRYFTLTPNGEEALKVLLSPGYISEIFVLGDNDFVKIIHLSFTSSKYSLTNRCSHKGTRVVSSSEGENTGLSLCQPYVGEVISLFIWKSAI